MNPYAYAGSNPVMNSDSSGLFFQPSGLIPLNDNQLSMAHVGNDLLNLSMDYAVNNFINKQNSYNDYSNYSAYAEVKTKGNDVNINIPIKYTGSAASSSLANHWKSVTEQGWSGQFGRYNVVTTVTDGTNLSGTKVNIINVPSGNSRPNVVGRRTGTWPSGSADWQILHEMGHILGLPDQYTDSNNGSIPHAGYERNIMGSPRGSISEEDIRNVIKSNKSGFCKVFGC